MRPRRGARLTWIIIALVATTLARAEAPVPPERRKVLEERARKVVEARATGRWIVAPGEHVRLIARQFFPADLARERRLAHAIAAANPRAFVGGDPDRLIAGARLEIPAAALGAAPPAAANAPPAPVAAPAPVAEAPSPVTVVPAPEFAPGPPRAPPRPEPPAYVDQLIEGIGPELPATSAENAALEPGQRYVSAEYRVEARDPAAGGHGLEQGVEAHLRRETLDYGDFYLEGAVRDTRLPSGETNPSRRNGGRFTLYQEHFPVAEGWIADSGFGVVRTPPNFLNSSYRIFLPTSLMAGATTVVSDGRQSITGYAGHVGRLEGSAVQSFDPTSGNIAGLAYTRSAGPWTVGGEAIGVRGSVDTPDHAAGTLAVEYGGVGELIHHKAQVVADDRSNAGAWYDGDVTTGRMRQRFGLYQLDPGLEWGEAPISADQRGGYWRADYRMLRYTLSGGAELAETNLRSDPSKAQVRSGTAYGTFSLRIDRNLTVGAGLTLGETRNRFTASARGRTSSATTYASWTNPLGLSRFDVNVFRGVATDVPDNTIDTFTWSQEWPALGPIALTSTLTHSRESQLAVRTRRSTAGVSARGPLFDAALWDASVVFGRISGQDGAQDNVNVSASINWPIARNWSALGQVSINTFEALPVIPGAEVPVTQHDRRVLVGVRYEESSGTPYQALGLGNRPGSGRLSGVIFFDENGDGLRQPGERGAANVTIYLDGRFPVTTDAQGRYAFPAVTPGAHRMRILSEALPLPWTLDEDHPPIASVPLRGDAIVDIPLTKIRP